MLNLILFVGLLVAMAKTRPQEKQFKEKKYSKLKSLFSKPKRQFTDYLFFTVLESDGELFLGIFSSFIQIRSKQEEKQQVETSKADSLKSKAIKLKAKKDYKPAADLLVKGADIYFDSTEDIDKYEAASMYEDAFKCYKMAGEMNSAFKFLKISGNIYESLGRSTSAARCFQILAENEHSNNNIDAAISLYEKVFSLYETENDSRSLQSLITISELASSFAKYDKAKETLLRLIVQSQINSVLQYRQSQFLLSYFFILIATDFTNAETKFMELPVRDEHVMQFWEELQQASVDSLQFDQTVEKFDRHFRFQPWMSQILSNLKANIRKNELEEDLT